MTVRDTLIESWHRPNALTCLLWPLSLLYRLLFSLNRWLYQVGIKSSFRAPVPVIIVGNITVGGTGKTPLVIHLVELLRTAGIKPGVISRGYGGHAAKYPMLVTADTAVVESGDEPALIVRRTGVPLCVGPNRKASIQCLMQSHEVDVIISDDGLQHFALQRDIEICVFDASSPMRNGFLLPAGPYREPRARLESFDFVVQHGPAEQGRFCMSLAASRPEPLKADNPNEFGDHRATHAVAGIGNPERFYQTCVLLGLTIIEHRFADHHQFSKNDIDLDGQVLMTEKDAVKCVEFADHRHWFLPVNAQINNEFDQALTSRLRDLIASTKR